MDWRILAIDIGGTNTKLAFVDGDGNVDHVHSLPTDGSQGVEPYLNTIEKTIREMLLLPGGENCDGIGIAVAGFIDPAHSMMVFNPNIPWLENFPLRSFFLKKFGLPVSIEVDSNAAALAEAVYGNGKDSPRLLVLTIGTGLGGGMMVDGKVLRIANECLGDVGHVIVDPAGPQCSVGCHGCAEALVSAPALERYATDFVGQAFSSSLKAMVESGQPIGTRDIIAAVHAGDTAACQAVEKLACYLGIALASMVPVFAPDSVCLAGGVSEAGALLLEVTEERFLSVVGPAYAEGMQITKAKFGWQAGLIGAACAFQTSMD
jgi:glucokinase